MNRMLRVLEISWLIIMIVSVTLGTWRWIQEGFACAIWFYFVTIISGIAYGVRRKQRLGMGHNEKQ